MKNSSASTVTRMLGYAGLIPFVLPALLMVSDSSYAAVSAQVTCAYALAIICFLCGSWWGMAQTSGLRVTLVLSNVFLLLALLLYLLVPEWWPLASALLLVGAWICEQNRSLFPAYLPQYRHMRALLTVVAASSLGLVQLAA